ncbi:hypothetical protein ACFQ3K_01155 [Brucella gallinifaecis]|uniref:hypothetical protein n=1 Tax=Brucella TaxID=234 RepID=UPI001AED0D47|nr:hypothetical protein [Brucella gallinifaecis]
MGIEDGLGHASPSWFTAPGDADMLAWVALTLICLALYGIVTLYAVFDRWAEHRSKGTPLAKTIPTLLTIALLYEIFPLEHFHVLLPLTAILLALLADWSRFHLPSVQEVASDTTASPAVVSPELTDDVIGPATPEAPQNV